jgi:hypothetical protein
MLWPLDKPDHHRVQGDQITLKENLFATATEHVM